MKLLFSLAFLSLTLGLTAQTKGTIFIDTNGNGKLDDKERGMQSVTVSDGYAVVQTDNQGNFELPHNTKARFVQVRVPAGHQATKAFYLKINADTKAYNIGLKKDANQQADKLDFIQITDTETPLYGTWIDNVRKYASLQGTSLIMHTGDICYEPGMRFHAEQVNSQLMNSPVYYAVGNHDLVQGEYGEKFYEDHFGPTYYSFEAGPAYFVVTPMWGGDYAPSYTKDQVIAWLKKDLATKDKDKPLIFVNHDFSIGSDFVLKGKIEEIDLKQYNLKAWLFGHWHNNYVFKSAEHDVTVVSTNAPNKGGIDHSVGQFLHIEVDTKGVSKITPVYTNLKDKIHLQQPIIKAGQTKLLANIYDSERKVVEVKLTAHDKSGQPLFDQQLVAKTDWAWEATTPAKNLNRADYALLEVRYANGEYVLRRQDFDKKAIGFQIEWAHNLGSNIWKSGALVLEDKVFAATFDDGGNGRSAIVALDRHTGERLWSFKTANSVKQKVQAAKGKLLATDVAGNVYALDLNTGAQLWTKDLSGGRLPNYVTGSALYDGVYYAGSGNYLTALDINSGEEIWRNTAWNGGEAMPGEMLATAEQLFTATNWNSLFAHNRKTGELQWRKSDEGVRFRSGGVALQDGELYIPGLNTLLVTSPLTGEVIRKKEYDHEFKVMASPLVRDDLVIIPNSIEGVSAYNRQSLERVWNFKTQEAFVYTSSYTTPDLHKLVSTVEGTVQPFKDGLVFGASDGYLYFLDKKGQLKDKLYFGSPILADVTVQGEQLFVADFAGNVYALNYKK